MVKDYGCPPSAMRLVLAHRAVEGDHRQDAWHMVTDHVHGRDTEDAVVRAVEKSLGAWLRYRDGVARAMGLTRQGTAKQSGT